MSLNSVISALGAVTLQVTRTAAGARDGHGRYVPGAASTFNVLVGIPEPAAGRQLMDLPEGRRGDETLVVYSTARLIPISPDGGGSDTDLLRYLGADANMIALMGEGEPWTVVTCKTWSGLGETHFECMMQRAPSPAGLVP